MNSHNTQNNYLNLNKDRYINSPLTYSNHYYSIVIICIHILPTKCYVLCGVEGGEKLGCLCVHEDLECVKLG